MGDAALRWNEEGQNSTFSLCFSEEELGEAAHQIIWKLLEEKSLEGFEQLGADDMIELYRLANYYQIDFLQNLCLQTLFKAIRYNLLTAGQLNKLKELKVSHAELSDVCNNLLEMINLESPLLPNPTSPLIERPSPQTPSFFRRLQERFCTIM
ncbi:hypothetical protein [Parendozoicomonas sp. Alg238-R29]|uniref:hypothetical protein n=1 Tax=Parendozoicomonas sp. Alg238-R29 TaxID=2993446 RepID=UPI00248D8E38|nr:hypothetical protein [Parendozoicomonas sp. Alg238-R29]